jgi:hypothetical protein
VVYTAAPCELNTGVVAHGQVSVRVIGEQVLQGRMTGGAGVPVHCAQWVVVAVMKPGQVMLSLLSAQT